MHYGKSYKCKVVALTATAQRKEDDRCEKTIIFLTMILTVICQQHQSCIVVPDELDGYTKG